MPAEVSISQQVGRMQNEKLKKLNNRKDKPKMANEKQREGDKSIHFIIHNSFAGNKQYAQERQVVRMKQKKNPSEIHLLLSFHFYARFITSAIFPREIGIQQIDGIYKSVFTCIEPFSGLKSNRIICITFSAK